MRVIDVVSCGQNVQGVILVIDVARIKLSAFMAIGKGKGIRSLIVPPFWITDDFTETINRDLTESIQQIEDLRAKTNWLLQALKNVAASANLDPSESANIRDVVDACDLENQDTPSMTPSTRTDSSFRFLTSSDQTPGGEHYVDATVGSPGRQDMLTHSIDMGRGRGTVGFVGKISEVSWVARAYAYLVSPTNKYSSGQETISNRISATQLGYFMDDENLLSIDEDYVDAYHWPGDITAQILSEAFFHALYGIFHSFAREKFLEELSGFPRKQGPLSWDQRRWLALTNLMWAIGSKWLHQAMLNGDSGIENHLVYYARARALGIDHRVMLHDQGLHDVKALGMLSFYLFTNGSVSRAWALVGLAIRNATCLGLHLKLADGAMSPDQMQERALIWFSLYTLEVAMSEILGKPPSLSLTYTTVPLELLEGDSNADPPGYPDILGTRRLWLEFLRGTSRRDVTQTMRGGHLPWQNFQFIGYGAPRQHLTYRTRLSIISNQVMTQLYMPNQAGSWAAAQKRMTGLNALLLEWQDSLPEKLNIESTMAMRTDPRAKIDLALYYYSVKMILHRPCLCRIQILGESTSSKEFNISNAGSCVYAAISLIDTLPDDPTAHEAYQLLPWWNLLHYLGQALAVFILELCLNMEHLESPASSLTPHVQKAMSYLWCLTPGSLSSYKAWRIFQQMLAVLSLRFDDFDITGIAMAAQVPTGWTDVDDALLSQTLESMVESGLQD